jgi:hypothetical protein
VLATLIRKIGLLPILSDHAPRRGALRKEKKENVANKSVTTIAEAPNSVT